MDLLDFFLGSVRLVTVEKVATGNYYLDLCFRSFLKDSIRYAIYLSAFLFFFALV